MGRQPEGMHLVLERTEGRISSQAVESRGIEKAMPEELSITLSDKRGALLAMRDHTTWISAR